MQVRRNRRWGEGGLGVAAAPPRFLLNSIFYELKKVLLKWKIVQNYKTSWTYSRFVDTYNIITDIDTTDGVLLVKNCDRFSHF